MPDSALRGWLRRHAALVVTIAASAWMLGVVWATEGHHLVRAVIGAAIWGGLMSFWFRYVARWNAERATLTSDP